MSRLLRIARALPAAWHRRSRTTGRALALGLSMGVLAGVIACTERVEPQTPETLFELAELDQLAVELTQALGDALPVFANALPPEQRARLEQAVEATARPGPARDAQLAGFSEAWNAAHAARVAEWYRSEAGRRLLAMESQAASADWEHELSPFIDEMMQAEPASLERVKALDRIGAAVDVAESNAAALTGIDRILVYAVRDLTPPADRLAEPLIEARLAERHTAARASMRMQLGIMLQFVYRDASDEDLALQVGFVESEAGRWLVEANRAATQATLVYLQSQLQTELSKHRAD